MENKTENLQPSENTEQIPLAQSLEENLTEEIQIGSLPGEEKTEQINVQEVRNNMDETQPIRQYETRVFPRPSVEEKIEDTQQMYEEPKTNNSFTSNTQSMPVEEPTTQVATTKPLVGSIILGIILILIGATLPFGLIFYFKSIYVFIAITLLLAIGCFAQAISAFKNKN